MTPPVVEKKTTNVSTVQEDGPKITGPAVEERETAEVGPGAVPVTVPAPTGGIVDRDFVGRQTPPSYAFAGSNMAGEALTECDQCRALVKESGQERHSSFHAIVNGTANRIGMQAG